VVERTIYAEIPPRVEYKLSKRGKAAWPVIEALRDWGETLPRK
jgi:DNA-binding HxlR family transcriptional regulator